MGERTRHDPGHLVDEPGVLSWHTFLADRQAVRGAGRAVAFGNFDGVHVGHAAILDQLRAVAAREGLVVAVVTFDPHPLRLLRPERAPAALEPLSTRLRRLHAAGADEVWPLRFDEALRDVEAAAFAAQLFGTFGARVVVASADARFGRGGVGDLGLLSSIAASHGARVLQVPPVSRDGAAVSSSRVRRALEAGDIGAAAAWLGRPPTLEGRVIDGDKRGRTLGFPTANLDVGEVLRPATGVYAGWLEVGLELRPAVANLGMRPTVAGAAWRCEAHLLDFAGDLYGQAVRLHLRRYLRGEQRFADLDALRAAIAGDADAARRVAAEDVAAGAVPGPLWAPA